eukprot:Rhum_TRINITY_DN23383_c0_g1::Rhum_TRINITY_DN23383_c0_g1_i1::g.177848::m.177848
MVWVRLEQLHEDFADYEGMVGRVEATREEGLIAVRTEERGSSGPGDAFLVPAARLRPVAHVPLPDEMHVADTDAKSHPVPTRTQHCAYTDDDGDEIVFAAAEKRGHARYAVNGRWRESATEAAFFPEGREGRRGPHIRLDCGRVYRNLWYDAADTALVSRLVALLNFAGVPHSEREFAAGDQVLLVRGVAFAEGDAVPEGTRAVVLTLTEKGVYETCVANGDRMDVPAYQLLPAPPLPVQSQAFLQREVAFESGKAVSKGALVTIMKRGGEKGKVEVRQGNEVRGVTFDVSEFWLRGAEGDILK